MGYDGMDAILETHLDDVNNERVGWAGQMLAKQTTHWHVTGTG